MNRLEELRQLVAYLQTELRAIHEGAVDDNGEARSLNDDENQRFNDGVWLRDAVIAEGIDLERRLQVVDANIPNAEPGDGARGAPAVIFGEDPFDPEYIRTAGVDEAFKRAVGETPHVSERAKEEIERKAVLERSEPENMRGFREFYLRHSSDDYCRGFFKLMSGANWAITPAEGEALMSARAWDQERGLTLTAANGGAMIPTHLDPSVVLTNAGVVSPLRAISRVVPIMTNVWNGVSSAGVTFAWSTEGGDSSDIAATYLQPSVTAYKYHGTVPVTIEAFEDISGLGDEVARELADGRERLLGAAFATGSGSGQPTGIVTAIAAAGGSGNPRLYVHATNNAFTSADVIGTQNALGSRYQPSARWASSLTYGNRVRAFGDDKYFNRTVTLDQSVSERILGKPWHEVSDMTTTLSTATNNALVYGDFSNYLIAERVGMEVEFIPHLFSTGNGLPNGRRGWYAHGRVGADSINDTGFVLSVNPGATG
jgi:HK97 family phage major capsid protein